MGWLEVYPSIMAFANPPRVPVTLPAKQSTMDMARELGVDVQAVCEQALGEAASRRWREANKALVEARNAWVEEHGLPLERYRLF